MIGRRQSDLLRTSVLTPSGLMYKKADPEEIESAVMEETLKSIEKMMQQLMEDRCKREEEFALERAACEKEAEK